MLSEIVKMSDEMSIIVLLSDLYGHTSYTFTSLWW